MTEARLTDAEALTHVARQIAGVVLLSWQHVLRAGLISAAATLLVAEVVACLVTSSFPPPPIAHLVTGALAFAVGYSVAITALFALLLRGGVRFIRHLEGDVTIGAEAASVFARREVGDLGAGLRRIFGGVTRNHGEKAARPASPSRTRPTTRPRPAIPARGGVSPVAVAAVGVDVARVALPYNLPADVRRDPDDAVIRTPPPAMQSLPVLAARLPRIGWVYDEQLALPIPTTVPVSSAPSPTPPTVSLSADPPEAADGQAMTPPPAPTEAPDDPGTPDVPEARDAVSSIPDAPGLIPRGWRRSDPTTRPLPAITRPLPTPSGARSGSLWDRVSQALVGQAQPETQPETSPETQPADTAEAHTEQPQVLDTVAPEDAWLNG